MDNSRIKSLEDDLRPDRTMIEIEIVHEETILDSNGEKRKVRVSADSYIEDPWSNAGGGQRVRVRWPQYKPEASHGISCDRSDRNVTGD